MLDPRVVGQDMGISSRFRLSTGALEVLIEECDATLAGSKYKLI